MPNKLNLPRNPEVAGKAIEAQSKERGLIGVVFGTKEHAPTNIAAVSVVLLIGILALLLFVPMAADVDRGALITALISTVTFALGLLFGKSTHGDRE